MKNRYIKKRTNDQLYRREFLRWFKEEIPIFRWWYGGERDMDMWRHPKTNPFQYSPTCVDASNMFVNFKTYDIDVAVKDVENDLLNHTS